jgi:hypothetical protein
LLQKTRNAQAIGRFLRYSLATSRARVAPWRAFWR